MVASKSDEKAKVAAVGKEEEEEQDEIQLASEKNDTKAFYLGLKEVYGPQKKSTTQPLDKTILNDKKILNRFAQHCNQLLNLPSDTDHTDL